VVSRTYNCARLLIVPTPVLKAAIKSTKVVSCGKNVCDVIIVDVVNMDAQTNKHTGAEKKSNLTTSWAHMEHMPGW